MWLRDSGMNETVRQGLIQAALLDNHILSDNKPVSGHFAQLRQHSTHVLISIHESDNHRELPTRLHQMRCLDFASAKKSSHRMQYHRSRDVFIAQVFEDLQMQWTVVP